MEIFWVAAIFFLLKKKLVPKTYSPRSCPTFSLSPPPSPQKMYFNFRMLLENAIVAGVIIVCSQLLFILFLGGGVISFRNNVMVKIMSLVTVLQKKKY